MQTPGEDGVQCLGFQFVYPMWGLLHENPRKVAHLLALAHPSKILLDMPTPEESPWQMCVCFLFFAS